jgi:hypothetical protein
LFRVEQRPRTDKERATQLLSQTNLALTTALLWDREGRCAVLKTNLQSFFVAAKRHGCCHTSDMGDIYPARRISRPASDPSKAGRIAQRSPRGKAAACACRVMVISESLRGCRAYIHISLPVAGVDSPSAVRHASVPTNSSLTADDRHCCVCAANAPEAWIIGDSPAGNWRPGVRGEAS